MVITWLFISILINIFFVGFLVLRGQKRILLERNTPNGYEIYEQRKGEPVQKTVYDDDNNVIFEGLYRDLETAKKKVTYDDMEPTKDPDFVNAPQKLRDDFYRLCKEAKFNDMSRAAPLGRRLLWDSIIIRHQGEKLRKDFQKNADK